ncbi:MAG: HD domain-containing protein [Zestosphaera sp.]
MSSAQPRKYVFDEIHGYIVLDNLTRELIDTPPLQRLRRIKQLSQAWYVFPGAVHTRFSHSLGVMRLAEKVADKLISDGLLRKDERDLLRVAALLHDIGHTPYSHALEYVFYTSFGVNHEELSYMMITEEPHITEALSSYGLTPSEVAEVVTGGHENVIFSNILGGDLNVDRLDYLPRDALHTGVKYGLIDLERIIQTLTLDGDGNVAVLPKAIHAVESFYVSRLHMYRSVYYHKTITGYQLLLASIYELMMSEREVKSLLEPFTSLEGIRRAVRDGSIAAWDDFLIGGVMDMVLARKLGSDVLRGLIKSYVNRRGYRAVYNHISFKQGAGITPSEMDKLDRVSRSLLLKGLGTYIFRTYTESVPIISREGEARVIREAKSLRISEIEDSIVGSLPRYMEIVRIYALPEVEDAVKNVLNLL